MKVEKNVTAPLTATGIMLLYRQQTRQASALRDTLNSGGFLFSKGRGGAL